MKRRVGGHSAQIRWDTIADAASDFAMNVELLAHDKNLSIKKLAEKAGLAERTLWNILKMKNLPNFATVVFLARVLGVHHSDLLLRHKKLKARLAAKDRRRRKLKGRVSARRAPS